jgi:hypothetical protein
VRRRQDVPENALHLGCLLVDVIDDLWKEEAAKPFLEAPPNDLRIARLRRRLLARRGAPWLRKIAELEAPYKPPLRRAAMALGHLWWRRIDANGWVIEVVADEADPLTVYGRSAPAWVAAVRERRPNALAHALSQLFEAISNGV